VAKGADLNGCALVGKELLVLIKNRTVRVSINLHAVLEMNLGVNRGLGISSCSSNCNVVHLKIGKAGHSAMSQCYAGFGRCRRSDLERRMMTNVYASVWTLGVKLIFTAALRSRA
jgi:hypothetical protein